MSLCKFIQRRIRQNRDAGNLAKARKLEAALAYWEAGARKGFE
jgi:hypothetical protein